MVSHYHPAPLDAAALDSIHSLEADLGKVVVALEPDRPAALTEAEVHRLRSMEERLGVVIVAYESP